MENNILKNTFEWKVVRNPFTILALNFTKGIIKFLTGENKEGIFDGKNLYFKENGVWYKSNIKNLK